MEVPIGASSNARAVGSAGARRQRAEGPPPAGGGSRPAAAAEWPLDPSTGIARCIAAFGVPALAFAVLWKVWLLIALSAEGFDASKDLGSMRFVRIITPLLRMPYWLQD